MPETRAKMPEAGSRAPVPARPPDRILPSQSSPSTPASFAWHPPVLALVTDGSCGRFVVKDNQGVDGDAGLRIKKKRIDVDRGDPAFGVRHQVRQPNERLHDGSFVQR